MLRAHGFTFLTPLLLPVFTGAAFACDNPTGPSDRQIELFFEKKIETLSPALRKELEQMVRDLGNQEPHERREIREKLLSYGKLATPFLVREVRSGNLLRVSSALLALGSLRDEESLPFLREELEKNRGMAVTFAALALGKCSDRQAMPSLSELGERKGATSLTRAAAALALGRLGTPEASDLLLKAVRRETDTKVLGAIVLALGRSAPRQGAEEEIAKLLKGSNDSLRRVAALALGDLGDERAVSLLVDRLLSDEDGEVRHCAAVALSRFPTAEATSALLEALKREVSPDRQAAILLALANHSDGRILDTLVRMARARAYEVRRAALIALSRFPGDRADRALVQALLDSDGPVRAAAVLVLAVGGASSQEAGLSTRLEKLAMDSDPAVRRAVAFALGPLAGKAAIPTLRKLERSPEASVSGVAASVRARLERGEDTKPLLAYEFSTVCSRSEELRRAYANGKLWDLFELGRRLEKPSPSGGPQSKTLAAPLQDLRLWLEADPYF